MNLHEVIGDSEAVVPCQNWITVGGMKVTTTPGNNADGNVWIVVGEEADSLNTQSRIGNLVRLRNVVVEFQLAGTEQNLVRHRWIDDVGQINHQRSAEIFCCQLAWEFIA